MVKKKVVVVAKKTVHKARIRRRRVEPPLGSTAGSGR